MINDKKILNTLEKQGTALEPLEADVKELKQSQAQTNERLSKQKDEQARLEEGQAYLKTAVEALKAGQNDIRDKMATEWLLWI